MRRLYPTIVASAIIALSSAAACGGDDGGSNQGDPDAAVNDSDGGTPGPMPTATPNQTVGASITDVAVGPDGEVVLVGGLSDPYDFGDGTVTPGGNTDILIARYDPDGQLDWVKHFGGADNNWAQAVDIDASGNIYVTGELRGTADFGGGLEGDTPGTGGDLFLVSFQANGGYRWGEVWASDGGQIDGGTGIAVGTDFLYVAGRVGRIMDLGGGTLGNLNDHAYGFIARFDKDTGLHSWSKGLAYSTASSGYLALTELVIDSNENLYISGMFRGTADLGDGDVNSSKLLVGETLVTTETGFVSSFGSSNGAFRWLKIQDGDNQDSTNDLAVDGDDNIYAIGSYAEEIEVGGGTLTDSDATSIPSHFFYVSYSSAGSYRFHGGGLSTGEGNPGSSGWAVVAMPDAVNIGFQFQGLVRVGDQTIDSEPQNSNPSLGSYDAAVLSIDPSSGSTRWIRSYGGGGDDRPRGGIDDGNDSLFIMDFSGVVTVGGTSVEPAGDNSSTVVTISE